MISKTFNNIVRIIKTKENYLPQKYQTIGGMWTVDTWKLGDIKYQLMDEGFTEVIFIPDRLEVVFSGYSEINFVNGDKDILENVLEELEANNENKNA